MGSDYSPETIQKVPNETEAIVLERKEEELEEESSQKKLFLYPSPFSESVYYQGTVSEYVGHEFKPVENGKLKGKISSKTRKLFSRAYRSCLDSDPFHVDPSQSLLTLQSLQKTCIDRLRFSTVIPEASISGFGLGFMEEIYTYYLPELNACKRALPQYKDDKKALRKELRALEAARLEPSTADYPMRCHQDIINTYAEMNEDSKPEVKPEQQHVSIMESAPSQIPFSQSMSLSSQQNMSLSSNQGHSTSGSITITPQISQSSIPPPTLLIPKVEKPISSPAKIKLKIKKETSSPLKITIGKQKSNLNESNISHENANGAVSNGAVSNGGLSAVKEAPNPIVKIESGPASALTSAGGQIKCICQHSTVDFGRFMIACDSCEVWFHGECVKVTAESVHSGAQWLCLRCSID